MTIRGSTRTLLALLFALALAACGNDDNNTNEPPPAQEPPPAGGGGEPSAELSYRLGMLTATEFTAGEIEIRAEEVLTDETTTLVVHIVDQDEVVYPSVAEVSFSSACAEDDLAELESPIETIGGRAESHYTAKGCNGLDEITAKVTINGKELTATGKIRAIQTAKSRSVAFVSTSAEVLAPQGLLASNAQRAP